MDEARETKPPEPVPDPERPRAAAVFKPTKPWGGQVPRARRRQFVHARVQNVGGARDRVRRHPPRVPCVSRTRRGARREAEPTTAVPDRIAPRGPSSKSPSPSSLFPSPTPTPLPGRNSVPVPVPVPVPGARGSDGVRCRRRSIARGPSRRRRTNGVLRAAEETAPRVRPRLVPLVFSAEEGVAVVLIVAAAPCTTVPSAAKVRRSAPADALRAKTTVRSPTTTAPSRVVDVRRPRAARGDRGGDDRAGAVAIASGEGVGAVHAGEHRGGSPARGSHGAGDDEEADGSSSSTVAAARGTSGLPDEKDHIASPAARSTAARCRPGGDEQGDRDPSRGADDDDDDVLCDR